MKYFFHLVVTVFLSLSLVSTVNADFVGDTIEASLTLDPDSSSFDESAISGTSTVIDPGREYQAEVYSLPNGVTIDHYIDINSTELTFGFVRTDSSNGGFGAGQGRVFTLSIWDIDWTGNPIEVDYLSSSTSGNSAWDGDPANFLVTTTESAIHIDFDGAISLGGNGGEISATFSISSVPEPSAGFAVAVMGAFVSFRRRRTQ